MSFRYGFFNSKNGDRKYFASDISRLFSGLIEDGVFGNVPDGFPLEPTGGLSVSVGKGFAWFNDSWCYVDAPYPLSFETANVLYDRIDAVVIEVHNNNSDRICYLKVVKGTPAAEPVKPSMSVGGIPQHPLAYVRIPANTTAVEKGNIESVVGTDECPFIVGIQKTASVGELYNQWQAEFDKWFSDLKTELEGDVAANLQSQITSHVTNKAMHIPTLGYSKEGAEHKLTGLAGLTGIFSAIFRAEDTYNEGDLVSIDGEQFTIQLTNGDIPGNELFVSGAVVPIIVDMEEKKVNFKAGGPKKQIVTELIATTQEWTVPSTVRSIMVTVFGAGGAARYGTAGNGGNMASGTFDVTPGEKYTITIGSGASGDSYNSGGSSSFGTLLSASGGATAGGGKGGGNGGAAGSKTDKGTYGGNGGVFGKDGSQGTNTVGMGLEFEGSGSGGSKGVKNNNAYSSVRAGGGGSGGYGGNGGRGGDTGSDGKTPNEVTVNGGSGGNAGGGGYGAPGGDGGNGGTGGSDHGCTGGDGGHGGGGGYGAPGGAGGRGGNGGTRYLYEGGKGGNGGGGGYGPDGAGGKGGNGGGGYGGNGGNGGNGGIAAGGGAGGYGGGHIDEDTGTGTLGDTGSGGSGGNGICIIRYTGYR